MHPNTQLGLVICCHRRKFEVQAISGEHSGKRFQCVRRKNLDAIVTGDIVQWQLEKGNSGVIESYQARKSLLERPDNFGKLKPVASNIEQMLIVIACVPTPQSGLIDRYLIAAHLTGIEPILVLNKADLIDKANRHTLESLLKTYETLGYKTVQVTSARQQPAELNHLPNLIKDKTSIVVGQSGVGKSSLINSILPEQTLAIGELSHLSEEGRHTTTQATLYHLPFGGHLIDSPGIRDFSLWHINQQQLQQGFIEIAQLNGQCRFRDCHHENEPDCAILNAANNGDISEARFQSYQKIKQSIKEQQARGLTLKREKLKKR